MRTLSLICCLFLVGYGCIAATITSETTSDFVEGSIVMLIGSLAFIIITKGNESAKKNPHYNPNSFMNK
jgi:hypothetical protein